MTFTPRRSARSTVLRKRIDILGAWFGVWVNRITMALSAPMMRLRSSISCAKPCLAGRNQIIQRTMPVVGITARANFHRFEAKTLDVSNT